MPTSRHAHVVVTHAATGVARGDHTWHPFGLLAGALAAAVVAAHHPGAGRLEHEAADLVGGRPARHAGRVHEAEVLVDFLGPDQDVNLYE
jgi:hypothetical protein